MESCTKVNASQVNMVKEAFASINNRDTRILNGYLAISEIENQTPDFFKEKGRCFDTYIMPPTESHEDWTIGVFATRLGMDVLRVSCNAGGRTYDAIRGNSRNTDRMFRGHDKNHFVVEAGFLSQLLDCERRNESKGFAYKVSRNPYSQEMMEDVMSSLVEVFEHAMVEYQRELMYNIGSFMVYTMGGGSPYE
jgi:hypothetical protein